MNEHDYNALLSSLNEAIAVLARHRTPDAASVEAYDTLKLARARVLAAVNEMRTASGSVAQPAAASAELIAA